MRRFFGGSTLLLLLLAVGLAACAPTQTSGKKQEAAKKNKSKLAVECLEAHNKWRRVHNVPPLQWDNKLAAFAQKRSSHIAASDGAEFKHPDDLEFGENLFWHSNVKTQCDYMVRGWYDELKLYDFARPQFAAATGHFTQLIWRDTTRVGCATAESTGPKGGLYLTCNYDPAGNFVGEFESNVPKPVSSSSSSTQRPQPASTPAATSSSSTTTALTPLANSTARAVTIATSSSTTERPRKKNKDKKMKKKNNNNKKKKTKKKKKKSKKKNNSNNKKPSSTTPPTR